MIKILALAALVAAPPLGAQQTAQSILLTSLQKQAARESSVDDYTLIQTIQLMPSPAYYEKDLIAGRMLFRLVPMPEWQERRSPVSSAAVADGMADAFDMFGPVLAAEASRLPGSQYFSQAMTNIVDSLGFYLRAIDDSAIGDGRAEAAAEWSDLARFAQRARFVGPDTVDGKPALHIMADNMTGITLAQPSGGGTFALSDVHLWLDATEYVQVRLQMNGTMTANGTTTPVVIEMYQLDYQAAGPLYLPGRQLMRLSGLMEAMSTDPKQRQELLKARQEAARMQQQLAQMQGQMAQMPASARNMISGQLTKAMAQLNALLSGGVLEAEILYRVYSINKGPPYDWTPAPPADR